MEGLVKVYAMMLTSFQTIQTSTPTTNTDETLHEDVRRVGATKGEGEFAGSVSV